MHKLISLIAFVVAAGGYSASCTSALTAVNVARHTMSVDRESTAHGTASRGSLEGGVMLPPVGENFEAYSQLGVLLGRTYTHDRVARAVTEAYAKVAETHPRHRYIYAEASWPNGGKFRPHRTHQNGLSVDFVVPVKESDGDATKLGCFVWNAWCYGVDFDESGVSRTSGTEIDFDALGAHLVALHATARAQRAPIKRVILAPDLRPELFASRHGAYIRRHIKFMPKKAWVRHDDHYHVDFGLR